MVISSRPVVLTSTVRSLQEGSQPTAIVSPVVRVTPPQTPSTPSSLPKETNSGLRSSRGSPTPQSSPSFQASGEAGVDTRTSVRSEELKVTALTKSPTSQSNSGSSGSSSFAQTSVKSKNRTESKLSSAMPLVGKSKEKDKNEFDCKYQTID